MQTKGTVTAIDGAYAVVKVRRRAMCDGCPHDPKDPNACGHTCAMSSLLGDRKDMTVRVKNTENAAEGDTVVLESAERTVLLSAFLFFILPLILAVAGYFIAGAIFSTDGARWIGALVGFVLAYVFGAVAERRARKSDTIVVMTAIAERAREKSARSLSETENK